MKIGIIGGSGLYNIEGIQDVKLQKVKTSFGAPSDAYVHGTLNEQEVYFLPRHGRGHRFLPSEINHRANICGFKMLGVERIISISAVGSLKEELRPRDIILPDQYYDRTKKSLEHTFFGKGIVAHVPFGEPTCPELRTIIADVARKVIRRQPEGQDRKVTERGTYINMEGPAFSTKAESLTYRKMGFDVVGMTSLAEAKLCREAEICYQSVAMVTDYDCWHETNESVTVEMIIGHLTANTALAKEILKDLMTVLPAKRRCICAHALQNAILTDRKAIPPKTKKSLKPIVGKYL
jgi:5'-methylthioadenosine phosphorylase